MENIDPKLYQHTPTVSVYDNRGLTIRNIDFHRSTAGGDTDIRITRHQYDARGHLSQSIDPRLYDAKQTDNSINPNFLWQYNLTGDTLRTESADAGRIVALNDIEGRQVLIVTATGVTQTRQYEANTLPGRLLSVSEQAPEEKAPRVTEYLIWAGNTQTEKDHNLAGQYVRHYDTAGVTQLKSLSLTENILSQSCKLLADGQEADWMGNDETLWQTKFNNETYTTQSTFDATGALLTQTDATGNIQRLAYNVAGQLKGSWLTLKNQSEQVIIKSLTYSAAGQKLREEHGNGVITEYRYEPETLRLISTTTRRQSDNKVLQDLRYEHDPVGNIISVRNDAEATRFWRNQKIVPENVYTYDSLYQLISATGREMANIGQQSNQLPSPIIPLPTDDSSYTNYTRSYNYDRGGNLMQIRHSSPATQNNYTTDITVSNRSNRAVLSSLATDSTQVDALFDAGGHQRKLLPGQDLSWNARGELQQVTPVSRENASDREWYRYGNDGMRQLKVSEQQTGNSTQQQRVTYLPGLELRTTQSGTSISEDLHVITVGAAGHAQVRVLHWETIPPAGISNNQLRYSYDNLIGSSQLELDNEGQIISQEEYYPFGGTALWAARNQIEASYKILRYSGKERDATGLYYYGYRYYQPWVGRWLSADPAGTVDGLNLYRMVRNNPIVNHDNRGLWTEEEWQQGLSRFTHALNSPIRPLGFNRAYGFNGFQQGRQLSEVNPYSLNQNCYYCTVSALSNTTTNELVSKTEIMQQDTADLTEIESLFRAAGTNPIRTDSNHPDAQIRWHEAFNFMRNSLQPGQFAGLAYTRPPSQQQNGLFSPGGGHMVVVGRNQPQHSSELTILDYQSGQITELHANFPPEGQWHESYHIFNRGPTQISGDNWRELYSRLISTTDQTQNNTGVLGFERNGEMILQTFSLTYSNLNTYYEGNNTGIHPRRAQLGGLTEPQGSNRRQSYLAWLLE
ncbi:MULTISPECIES: RHS repeat domain-containing protein [Photorhabdus]|uniref:Insecticidal toxin complex protein TccC n=1 Tax=Photorhabdus luminescens TaxID=29488 RepID=A0A1G5R5D5_PHOLU|nr:insecticidal toxin complex protein TccC [Photorhabdus luminescens]